MYMNYIYSMREDKKHLRSNRFSPLQRRPLIYASRTSTEFWELLVLSIGLPAGVCGGWFVREVCKFRGRPRFARSIVATSPLSLTGGAPWLCEVENAVIDNAADLHPETWPFNLRKSRVRGSSIANNAAPYESSNRDGCTTMIIRVCRCCSP